MQIAGFNLEERIMIVAEIGNNHEGSFETARTLVLEAADAGANAVKFQTFKTELFVSRLDPERFGKLKSFELTQAQFIELQRTARNAGLLFISTPLDLESAAFLSHIVDAFKIASGDNDFFPLLQLVARSRKPVIISSGMTDLQGIRAAKDAVQDCWRAEGITQDIAVLHCVTSYPAPADQLNLSVIEVMSRELGCVVGYSDHSIGNEACVVAAAAGARILEKHFTLDHNFSNFRDHQLSADPAELKALVAAVRRVEAMLGNGEKTIQAAEHALLESARRSVAAAADLPAGHRIALNDLMWIRPAGGIRPGSEGEIVGRKLKRAVKYGEQLRSSYVE